MAVEGNSLEVVGGCVPFRATYAKMESCAQGRRIPALDNEQRPASGGVWLEQQQQTRPS